MQTAHWETADCDQPMQLFVLLIINLTNFTVPTKFNTNMLLCSYFGSCRENELWNMDLLIWWSYRAISNTAQGKIFELTVPYNSRTTMTHTRRKKTLPETTTTGLQKLVELATKLATLTKVIKPVQDVLKEQTVFVCFPISLGAHFNSKFYTNSIKKRAASTQISRDIWMTT